MTRNRNSGNRRFLPWLPVVFCLWTWSQGTAFPAELPSLSDVAVPPPKAEKPAVKPWGRDPFLGPPRLPGEGGEGPRREASLPETGILDLNAIITRDGEGVAIINNEILRKGDRILDRRVMEIRRDRVILQGEAGTVELKVNPLTMGK